MFLLIATSSSSVPYDSAPKLANEFSLLFFIIFSDFSSIKIVSSFSSFLDSATPISSLDSATPISSLDSALLYSLLFIDDSFDLSFILCTAFSSSNFNN